MSENIFGAKKLYKNAKCNYTVKNKKRENNELIFFKNKDNLCNYGNFCTISEVKEMALTIDEIFMQLFCDVNFAALYEFQYKNLILLS